MAGVTHFERKDRAGRKKVHPSCPFCKEVFRATPKIIVKCGGPRVYIASFKAHLMQHLGPALGGQDMIVDALDAVSTFVPMVWDNC